MRCLRLIPTLLIVVCTGCITAGPKYTEDIPVKPAKARVFIYRPHPPVDIFLMNTYNYAHAPDIYHEGKKLVTLNVNAYTYVDIEPGPTVFSAHEKLTGKPIVSVDINVSAGQEYYLRYIFDFGVINVGFSLKLIGLGIAREEIRKTRYLASPQ